MSYYRRIAAGWYHIGPYTVRQLNRRTWVVRDIHRRPTHSAQTLRECREWVATRATEAS